MATSLLALAAEGALGSPENICCLNALRRELLLLVDPVGAGLSDTPLGMTADPSLRDTAGDGDVTTLVVVGVSGGGVGAASGEGKGYPNAAAACCKAAWVVALTEASIRVFVASQRSGAACTGSEGGLLMHKMIVTPQSKHTHKWERS